MNNLNSVLVEGNLTRDPMTKTTPSGAAACAFSIAVNRSYKKGDSYEMSYFDIEAWGKLHFLYPYFLPDKNLNFSKNNHQITFSNNYDQNPALQEHLDAVEDTIIINLDLIFNTLDEIMDLLEKRKIAVKELENQKYKTRK